MFPCFVSLILPVNKRVLCFNKNRVYEETKSWHLLPCPAVLLPCYHALTWWAASPEACWAPPHRAGPTEQVWGRGWRETWMVMDYRRSSSWSWVWPLCSERDEGSGVWGFAAAARLQSDGRHKCQNRWVQVFKNRKQIMTARGQKT